MTTAENDQRTSTALSAAIGQERAVPASRRLVLDNPDAAWIVGNGEVRIFAIEILDGEPKGQMHPLFTCGPGSVLIGAGRKGMPFQLAAIGTDTTATAMPILTRGLSALVRTSDGEPIGARVQHWVEQLANAVRDVGVRTRDPEAPTVHIGVGEETEVRPDQIVVPRGRGVWLPAVQPTTVWGYPVAGIVPLPPYSSAQLSAEATVFPISAKKALATPAGWDGVMSFLHACLELLADQVAANRQVEIDRQSGLLDYEENLETALYSDLAGLLTDDTLDRMSAIEGTSLLGALRLVGRAAGITIATPAAGILEAARDPLEVIARQSGFRTRTVALTKNWYRQDAGPLLAQVEADNSWVALLPSGARRYVIVTPSTGQRRTVDATLAEKLAFDAVQLYRPLSPGRVTGRELLHFALQDVGRDVWRVAASGLAVGLLALLPTFAARTLFETVVPHDDRVQLAWIVSVVVSGVLASGALSLYQGILSLRVETKATLGVQAAVFSRALELPTNFYRQYSSADLAVRSMGIENLRETLSQYTVTTVLAAFSAMCNIAVMLFLEPTLAMYGLIALAVGVLVSCIGFRVMARRQLEAQNAQGALFSTGVQMLGAVAKLRVARAERRAFSRWAREFGEMKRFEMRASRASALLVTFFAAFVPMSSAVMMIGAATITQGSLGSGQFIAFNTAFTQAVASLIAISASLYLIAAVAPLYHRLRPILDAEPEGSASLPDPGTLRGAVDVSNVSFRYTPDGPLVLKDVSFSARPGEMVALVGPSGSGKSSVLRLLLGFDMPETGAVSYDGQDLVGIDVRAVRRQCGVVIQGTRLMPGDIRYNIAGTRRMTLKQVREAAEIAGAEGFIDELPMGLETVVSEQGGAFSGGQKQMLLLARAMAGKPKIILLDEATSALDNHSQATVMRNVETLDATRIVIAHRLSTIRKADRVVVLVDGQVVQQGTFDELSDVDGAFNDLVRRQTL